MVIFDRELVFQAERVWGIGCPTRSAEDFYWSFQDLLLLKFYERDRG